MKGKEPIKQSKYFTMTSDGEVHYLKISEAFPEDEGNYYCIISNTIGKVILIKLTLLISWIIPTVYYSNPLYYLFIIIFFLINPSLFSL